MAAAEKGHLDIVQFLLDMGANIEVNLRPMKYQTPLVAAVNAGHLKIVQALLDKGANIEAVNDRGETPLMIAASKNLTQAQRVTFEFSGQFQDSCVSCQLLLTVTRDLVSSVRRSFAENFNFQSSNDSVCFCFCEHRLNTVLKIEVLSKTTSTLRNQISSALLSFEQNVWSKMAKIGSS